MYPIVCIIGKSMLVCSNAVQNTGWNSENGLIITESQNDWLKLEKTTKIQPVLSHTPHVHLTMCSVPYLHISWTCSRDVGKTGQGTWLAPVMCLILVTPDSKEWIWNTWGKQCSAVMEHVYLSSFLSSLHAFPTPDWNTVSSTICLWERYLCVKGQLNPLSKAYKSLSNVYCFNSLCDLSTERGSVSA